VSSEYCLAYQSSIVELNSHPVTVPNWYAIYTCVHQEKIVNEHLQRRRIKSYLPTYETVRQRTDRRVKLDLPLFPGYLFVQIPLTERSRVLEIPRVVRFVACHGAPVIVPAEDIQRLQKGLSAQIRAVACGSVPKGAWVRVVNGPFTGAEGVLMRRKRENRLVITMTTISRSFTVEIKEEDVERIRDPRGKAPTPVRLVPDVLECTG